MRRAVSLWLLSIFAELLTTEMANHMVYIYIWYSLFNTRYFSLEEDRHSIMTEGHQFVDIYRSP